MMVNKNNIRIKSQSGDGILSDIYSGAKKAYNWVKTNKPLTTSTNFLKNNAISQGLISLTPYSGQINSALDYGNIIGKKYGIGKKKKAKKTKKAKKAK